MTAHSRWDRDGGRGALAASSPRNFVDEAISVLSSRPHFYRSGWGDSGVIREVIARFRELEDQTPAPITVRWIDLPSTRAGVTRMRGFFETPARELPLPPEARAAYFELVLPEGASVRMRPPVCVYLAATGDQGMWRRRRLALPSLERGLGALILENPYYGLRRPRDQFGIRIESVADQMMMCLAVVQEARALLRWLRDGGFEHVGVSGYSLGGYMAACCAALETEAVPCVPVATGMSPASIFTESAMSRYPDWAALGGARGREALHALFDVFSLDTLPSPAAPELAVLVAGRRDAVVWPEQIVALARHWGSSVRWTSGGHITGFWMAQRAINQALLDVFGMALARSS